MVFSVFCQGEFRKEPKFHILLILTGNNALKWLEWCIFKVWGMPNPMALVASPYNKWFMKKSQFQETHSSKWGSNPWKWNGTYAAVLLGSQFTPTQCFKIQYLALPITNAEKPLIIQKVLVTQSCNIVHCNWHTQNPYMCRFASLCWTLFPCANWSFFSVFCQVEFRKQPKYHILFILTGKNGLKFLEWCIFKVRGMPNPIPQFWVSVISGSSKNHNIRLHFYILLILTGKNTLKYLEWCIFRVWGMPNPIPQVLSLCDKWFLKNYNFRQKFHILLILTGKNALKLLEWCIFKVWGMPKPMALVASPYVKWFMKKSQF